MYMFQHWLLHFLHHIAVDVVSWWEQGDAETSLEGRRRRWCDRYHWQMKAVMLSVVRMVVKRLSGSTRQRNQELISQ